MPKAPVLQFTTPFNQLLGIRITRTHADGVTASLTIRDELRNAWGTLHGGVTATLVDVAVGVAGLHLTGKPSATVELKVNYFLPLTDGRVTARARMLRVGSSLVVGSVEVKDARKRLAAFGTATYKLA
jgi:acyl-CoA thioesterase